MERLKHFADEDLYGVEMGPFNCNFPNSEGRASQCDAQQVVCFQVFVVFCFCSPTVATFSARTS